MMAAGLIGLAAGSLPRFKKNLPQLITLIIFAIVASFIYGSLMTLWNWPFLAGAESSVSYVGGASIFTNLSRFVNYEIVTGGYLWDTGRAITTAILIALTAPALLATLKRAANRAGFEKLSN
jgi:energy-coupling factor transport system substrate-specific component